MTAANLFKFRGQMLTARQLAELAGCSKVTMSLRLRSMSPEQAVAMGCSWSRAPKPIFYAGQEIPRAELAKAIGISKELLRDRLRRGHSVHDAIAMGGPDRGRVFRRGK